MIADLRASAERLDTVDIDRIVQESREHTGGVTAAADAGDDRVRQVSGHIDELLARLDTDDALEVAHHHRERMRPEYRTDTVDRVVIFLAVCLKGRIDRFLQGLESVSHLDDVRAENLHSRDIGSLLFDIDGAHIDVTFQAEVCRSGRQRYAVLTRAGLGNDFLFPHVFREQRLAHAVIELMRTRVVQILALCVKLNSAAELIG